MVCRTEKRTAQPTTQDREVSRAAEQFQRIHCSADHRIVHRGGLALQADDLPVAGSGAQPQTVGIQRFFKRADNLVPSSLQPGHDHRQALPGLARKPCGRPGSRYRDLFRGIRELYPAASLIAVRRGPVRTLESSYPKPFCEL